MVILVVILVCLVGDVGEVVVDLLISVMAGNSSD